MKLLLNSLVFFSFALVQNIGARPYPQDSLSASSLFGNWLTSSSDDYNGIYEARADLLTQGTTLATQVLDLVECVPGLESVSSYGKTGIKMAGDLGRNAVTTVNTFQENLIKNVTELGSYFPVIANGSKTIRSGIDTVLTLIEQVIDRIRNLSSVGENILSSLHMTRDHLGNVRDLLNYLPVMDNNGINIFSQYGFY